MSGKIKKLFEQLERDKQIKTGGKKYTIKDIKIADAGYEYAKE